MGTAFTYQGRLENASGLRSRTCAISSSACGTPSGAEARWATRPNQRPGVVVTDGLFTITVDFGTDAFNGDARWLAMKVCCCPSTCAVQHVYPRQELTPAPYALALLPGVVDPAGVQPQPDRAGTAAISYLRAWSALPSAAAGISTTRTRFLITTQRSAAA